MHKELKDILERMFDDEIKGALEYDEIIEKMPKEHMHHRKTLKEHMITQLGHAADIRVIMMEMGYHEPKNWQKLEDIMKIEEDKMSHTSE